MPKFQPVEPQGFDIHVQRTVGHVDLSRDAEPMCLAPASTFGSIDSYSIAVEDDEAASIITLDPVGLALALIGQDVARTADPSSIDSEYSFVLPGFAGTPDMAFHVAVEGKVSAQA